MWSNMVSKNCKRQDGKLNKMQFIEEKEKDNKKEKIQCQKIIKKLLYLWINGSISDKVLNFRCHSAHW